MAFDVGERKNPPAPCRLWIVTSEQVTETTSKEVYAHVPAAMDDLGSVYCRDKENTRFLDPDEGGAANGDWMGYGAALGLVGGLVALIAKWDDCVF